MLPNSYVQSMYINPQQQQVAPLPFGYTTNTPTKPVYQPQPPIETEYQMQVQPEPYREQIVVQQPMPNKTITLVKPKKYSYLIDWLLYILPIAFFIIILLIMALLFASKVKHFNPEGAHNTLETLKNNMQLTPIEDIVVATPSSSASALNMISHYTHDAVDCPDGYGKAHLGQWDGVSSGCICENGEISHSLTCFYKSNCKRVKSHDPQLFTTWQQKQYCTKLYAEWKTLEGAACETSYKQCGNVCVPQSKNCPLSGLLKDNSRQNDRNAIKIGTDNYIKQFENSSPIVSIEMIPGIGQIDSSPCYNHKLNPKFQSTKYYPLAKRPEMGCDNYKDLQSHRITLNTFSAHQTYQQNGLADVLSQLPFYQNYEDNSDTYALEAIKKIQINTNEVCQKLSPKDIDQISKSGQRVYKSERAMSLIIIISVGVILFLVPILYLMKNRIFQWIDMTEFHQPKFLCGIGLIIAILCIGLGAVYLSEVDGNNGLREHNAQFSKYLEKNCFPDDGLKLAVSQVNEFAKNTYFNTYSLVIAAFYVSIIFIVLLIIFVVYQYFAHKSLFDNPWTPRQQEYSEFH
ncbi:unnamed protein product [Paramecium pentaurelia]|uniref:Transmembrane protein n=1 Tax=Paramecium pentaurelia TaxID=43138 RepID=A0A8S1X0X0_9CILI|nr:unnamed protein product [Paramecium pentaurelia]